MLISSLDHLVLIAPTLEEGVAYCEAALGVCPPVGGEHALMGTHNRLLKLGRGVYLEVIAINPAASAPARTRWFGMDATGLHGSTCRLATFVVRSGNIVSAVEVLPALGRVCPMQRGSLAWQISIPDDGNVLEGGAMPSVIEWPAGVDPTRSMADLGCHLVRLEVFHSQPEHLVTLWGEIGLRTDDRLQIKSCPTTDRPYLVAYIETPSGLKMLSGRS